MKNKILIISPVPTHPPHAGNRSCILNYCQYFTNLGFQVHFMYIGESLPNDSFELMNNYWGDRLLVITPLFYSFKLRFYKHFRLFTNGILFYKIDDWFPWGVRHKIMSFHSKFNFDIIWVNYIWFSKALTFFKGVKKVIDTHDVFSFRYEKTGSNWYSTTPKQEKRAIDRSDLIVAIQDLEASFFRGLTTKSVITSYRPFPIFNTEICFNNNLLFIAGPNNHNVDGLNFLIHELFPLLILEHPTIKLIIGGGICDYLSNKSLPKGIVIYGKVSDLEHFYSLGNIVFNPIKFGTGLKIKTLEALSFGKILVANSHNVIGLPFPHEVPVLLADSLSDYQTHIRYLLQEDTVLNDFKESVYSYMFKYKNLVDCRMSEILF